MNNSYGTIQASWYESNFFKFTVDNRICHSVIRVYKNPLTYKPSDVLRATVGFTFLWTIINFAIISHKIYSMKDQQDVQEENTI